MKRTVKIVIWSVVSVLLVAAVAGILIKTLEVKKG